MPVGYVAGRREVAWYTPAPAAGPEALAFGGRKDGMTDTPTILITGATDGLGRALADGLAAEGAQLILHGRSREKLERAAAEIARERGGGAPVIVVADLADLKQVRDLGAQVATVTDHLDALVSNAGIGSGEPDGRGRRLSAGGYELRFAVNYL